MLFIALSLLGYVSYKQLPVELLPNAELPVLFVQVSSQQDMDPSYVESEVIIPLEGAVSAIGGVDKLQSYIDRRQSSIQIDFKKNINFKMTSLKLQEKVNEIAASLPTGFTVQVQKVDIAQMNNNFMVLQVRGTGGTDRVRSLVDEDVRSDLENIDGVASVNIYGGRQKAIEVRLNPEACKALNLTASKISGLLSQNTQEKTFVGFADEPDSKNFVHVNAMYTKVSDLENIVVAPGPILLKDLATVFFDLKDETTYSRVNGKEAVSVAFVRWKSRATTPATGPSCPTCVIPVPSSRTPTASCSCTAIPITPARTRTVPRWMPTRPSASWPRTAMVRPVPCRWAGTVPTPASWMWISSDEPMKNEKDCRAAVRDFCLQNRLLCPGQPLRLAAAVSGGADSMALLLLLRALQPEFGYTLSACHVNHGLRGAAADRDEAFVRQACGALGVPLRVFHAAELADTVDAPPPHAGEDWARRLRYACFERLCEEGIDAVATAHTANDQAETLLLRRSS